MHIYFNKGKVREKCKIVQGHKEFVHIIGKAQRQQGCYNIYGAVTADIISSSNSTPWSHDRLCQPFDNRNYWSLDISNERRKPSFPNAPLVWWI